MNGQINEEIEVSFDASGFDGIKCSGHFAIGMVMLVLVLVQVGDGDPEQLAIPTSLPDMVQDR